MQQVQSTSRSAISGSSLYLSGSFDTMDFSMPSYSDSTKPVGKEKDAPLFGNPFGEKPAADEAQVDKAAEKAAAEATKDEEKAAAEARKADEKEYATAKKAEEKAAKEAEKEAKKAEKEAAAAKKAEDATQAADKQAEKQARRQAELQKQREAVERSKAVEAGSAPAPAPAVSPINHQRYSSSRIVKHVLTILHILSLCFVAGCCPVFHGATCRKSDKPPAILVTANRETCAQYLAYSFSL
jgi:NADH dehydrogenase/NADH:ubiquinone oxidoreductase subunit G